MNNDARLLDLIGCNDRAFGYKYVLLLKREKWTCWRFKHDHGHWFSFNRLNVFDQEWCYPHNECRRQDIEPEDDSWTSTYNFVFSFADLGFAWELSPLSSFQFNLFLFGSGMLIRWLFYNYFRSQITTCLFTGRRKFCFKMNHSINHIHAWFRRYLCHYWAFTFILEKVKLQW